MKKNLFYLSMLAVALTVSSCSNDLDEGQKPAANNGEQAIAFKTWTNKLRATAPPTTTATIDNFAVLATNPTAPGAPEVLINGEIVTGGNGNWTYSPVAYWPDFDDVNFFAYSPSGSTAVTSSGGASALTGQDEATGPSIEYTLPLLPADQEDLLAANHTANYASEGVSGVPLNFHHALSRIKFQAKSGSGANFNVKSITLKNIVGKATLNLSELPKDDQPFAYPTNDTELSNPGYQTYWEPETTPTIVDLTADIPAAGVNVSGVATDWTDIVGDANALYVIPQENVKNTDYDHATELSGPGGGSSSDFYIEIAYTDLHDSKDYTYAVPVKAIVGSNPDASSLAFEIERQYTFRFELGGIGTNSIRFEGVTVCDFDEVDPTPAFYTATANGSRFLKSDTISLEFDRAVTGLTKDDFAIAGLPGEGAASPVKVEGSGKSWKLIVNTTAKGKVTVRIKKTGINPEPLSIYILSPFMEMVLVDGGSMQFNKNTPQTVQLSSFYIGKYELTQKQWIDVMGSWPDPGNVPSATYGVGDNFPAYYISWEDIVGTAGSGSVVEYTEKGIDYYTNGFCYKLTVKDFGDATGQHYRLPTEAEWEYAARGGQNSNGFTYSGSNTSGNVAWHRDNSGSAAHAVGGKQPNELDIYDMSGNVYEICGDWFGNTFPFGLNNPTGPATGTYRAFRGGSWGDREADSAVHERFSALEPNENHEAIGVRLAIAQ